MSIKSVVKAAIDANAPLTALLTGGVHLAGELSRQGTAAAFDANGEIRPCALVKSSTDNPDGPDQFASREVIHIFLYQRDSYDTIDQVLPLLFSLLHRQKIGAASDAVWETRWIGDVRDQEDQALSCSLSLSRFEVVRHRG